MDNVELKLVATAVAALGDADPSGFAPLEDLGAGPRVLLETAGGSSLVVEAVLDEAVAASLDAEHVATVALAARAVPFQYPRRLAAADTSRASLGLDGDDAPVRVLISEPLPGRRVSAEALDGDTALVKAFAKALAAIHDFPVDPLLAAGLPAFDSAELRDRLLADVDRAAQSGSVPASLLQRWEHEFETAGLWRFMPTVVHGRFTEADALVEASDVVAVTGWDGLKVADPAEDIAWVLSALSPTSMEAFFREYRQARGVADDDLRRRAELYSELSLVEWLLYGLDSDDAAVTADAEALLRELADMLHEEDATAPPATPDRDSGAPGESDDVDAAGRGPARSGPGAAGSEATNPETNDAEPLASVPTDSEASGSESIGPAGSGSASHDAASEGAASTATGRTQSDAPGASHPGGPAAREPGQPPT